MSQIVIYSLTCLAALDGSHPCFAEPVIGGGLAGPLKVGDKAPEISGLHPSGDALGANDLSKKTVVVAFWQLDANGKGMPLEPLREVRRLPGDNLLILTVSVSGRADNWDKWSKLLLDQGKVSYGDGERRFIDDSKWWNVMVVSSKNRRPAAGYGVTSFPAYFVIKPDEELGAGQVPAAELKATVQKLMK